MKPIWLWGVAGLAGAVVAAGTVYQAAAAPANAPVDAGPGGMPGDGPGWGHGEPGPGMMRHAGWHNHDMFGLFAKSQDKALTAADVKVIAQAILLEHGQHDWTVTDVTQAAGANGAIDFSYATLHGDVVAKFAVDPKTGHMQRVG